MTTTLHCTICDKDIEVPSRRQGLKHHLQTVHPEAWENWQEKSENGIKATLHWRCLKCEQTFFDTNTYRKHYKEKHE